MRCTRSELVLVLGITVLLAFMVIPALHGLREQLSDEDVICMSNQEALLRAWIIYADENNDMLVNSHVDGRKKAWVEPPGDREYTLSDDTFPTLNQKRRGVEKGLLFPYVSPIQDYLQRYHCPADTRSLQEPRTVFRSYSIAAGLNGKSTLGFRALRRYGYIKKPAAKYVFVEESQIRGWNKGSWKIPPHPQVDLWSSAPAVWHNQRTTLGFADGHVKLHKWTDKRTLDFALHPEAADRKHQSGNEDLSFMKQGFAYLLRY